MGSLHGPVVLPTVHVKQAGISPLSNYGPFMAAVFCKSEFFGIKGMNNYRKSKVVIPSCQQNVEKRRMLQCCLSSSSDGNGNKAENFSESDEHYVNTSVLEAVEVKSGADGFVIKMRDGRHLKCVHNFYHGGQLPSYAPHPAIVLKIEDGMELLLPIIVPEVPSVLLMAAVCNVQIVRPTLYQVVKEIIDKMGYEVKCVRITKRVHEAYFAQLYLTKIGSETECISFDLRPSDAINIAVRCKVPIQVNKELAHSDGLRVIESGKILQGPGSDGFLFTELDRPTGQPCIETEEFNLVRNMLKAAVEERYGDAAQWRDKLIVFRAKEESNTADGTGEGSL